MMHRTYLIAPNACQQRVQSTRDFPLARVGYAHASEQHGFQTMHGARSIIHGAMMMGVHKSLTQ
jgi:hypothetical protein